MIEINIDGTKLAAIALLASKNDTRFYLNGVYVEATATQTRLAATNGYYLGMHAKCNPLDANAGCEWETLILPPDLVAKCKPHKGTAVDICTVLIDERLSGDTSEGDQTRTRTYTMRLWDGTLIPFQPVQGVFPDIRRVVSNGTGDGLGAQFSPEYLMLFAKVAKALGDKNAGVGIGWNGPVGSMSIHVKDDGFAGVLMPVRKLWDDVPTDSDGYALRTTKWPEKGADVPEHGPEGESA